MDYIGKEVFHKVKYGKGIIINQDDSYISVRFDSSDSIRKFPYPACFKQFLQLVDKESSDIAKKAAEDKDKADKEETERKRDEAKIKLIESFIATRASSLNQKSSNVRTFSSLDAFYVAQEKSLKAEIAFLRANGGKRIKILDGKMVEWKYDRYVYSFESDSELNLPDSIPICLWPIGKQEGIRASVMDCEEFTIIISSAEYIGDSIPVIEFSAEPWQLIQFLIDRLSSLNKANSPIANEIVCNGFKKIQPSNKISTGQDTACSMSLSQPITFIWGPPGTGKTETLAKIAIKHLSMGYRVLMLSYSNVSVDGAIWRVYKKDSENVPGKLVRYGYPRDKELLEHEYLTSYNLTIMNHPFLLRERANLIEERKHLNRTSSRYVEIGQRLIQIKKKLDDEEKFAVDNASFVATTVSKAIADSTLYGSSFDTVIFDEASMAYIPQIVFSAGLAIKHFICMGDFAQLPPIVQSQSDSILNDDIFKYCGIVDAVENGYGHEWLCMLDIQYRMHPDIASFSSFSMYHGLLKSGEKMAAARREIVSASPFSGQPIQFVDLSGMMSVCRKTADNSRINVLSAMVSMGLAINAAKTHEVGIITPYNAQSRLLHAMARDVMENAPYLNKIACATVHQFQGSEKDVIIYDAVDCYRQPYPGSLLTNMNNNNANRLYNVAVTRARGKIISVANVAYMEKHLSKRLIFRTMIDIFSLFKDKAYGEIVFREIDSKELSLFSDSFAETEFLNDMVNAKTEVLIDIPGGMTGRSEFIWKFAEMVSRLKSRGVRVVIRTDNKSQIPRELNKYVIENAFITDPVVLIDRKKTWFGMPVSKAEFISKGEAIPTEFRPILRFKGKHFAQALYVFLEMNRTVTNQKVHR